MIPDRIAEYLRIASVVVRHTHTEMGCDPPAAVDDGRDRHRKLDRRDLKRLPEGDRGQLYRTDVIYIVHDGSCFSRQIDPRPIQQTKLFKIRIVALHADPHSNGYEDGVAGISGLRVLNISMDHERSIYRYEYDHPFDTAAVRFLLILE